MVSELNVLDRLEALIKQRQNASAETSYVASLNAKGLNKILEKVGEESCELMLAAKDAEISDDNSDLIYEMADLLFH